MTPDGYKPRMLTLVVVVVILKSYMDMHVPEVPEGQRNPGFEPLFESRSTAPTEDQQATEIETPEVPQLLMDPEDIDATSESFTN
ncbi:hypothetical protein LINPERHAP1_LOCUS17138, partial [Linum perenne]